MTQAVALTRTYVESVVVLISNFRQNIWNFLLWVGHQLTDIVDSQTLHIRHKLQVSLFVSTIRELLYIQLYLLFIIIIYVLYVLHKRAHVTLWI